MRAGPLSNEKVISLINRYFIPVYTVNEDYAQDGSAPSEEKAEQNRIYHEAVQAKLSTGTVHVYIVTPDGHPIDSLHVANAAQLDRLVVLLEGTIEKLKLPEGKPLVKPVPQSTPPKANADSLILHLTARGFNKGCWREFPAENWIVLNHSAWTKFLPPIATTIGSSWDIDRDVATKLLTHFYPQTENNDVSTNRIDSQSLKATLLSIQGRGCNPLLTVCNPLLTVRIDGNLKMKHTFYPQRDDNQFVEATVVGFVDFEQDNSKIRSLQLVTDKAIYGQEEFCVAVRSVP